MSLEPDNKQEKPRMLWIPRLLAVLLALGGCFWGLLLLPTVFRPNVPPLAVAILGPGYLVTLGYIVRSVSTPPLEVRWLIWGVSILVQGSWLAWIVWEIIERVAAAQRVNEPVLFVAWWVFATAASVAGLLAEESKQAEQIAAADRPRE